MEQILKRSQLGCLRKFPRSFRADTRDTQCIMPLRLSAATTPKEENYKNYKVKKYNGDESPYQIKSLKYAKIKCNYKIN